MKKILKYQFLFLILIPIQLKKINEGLNKFEYTPRIYWTKNSEKIMFFQTKQTSESLEIDFN